MKIFFLFLTFFIPYFCHADSVTLSVTNAQHYKKSQLLLALVGKETSESKEIAHLLKKALEFKGQCLVDLVQTPSFIKKKEALAYKQKGYDYIIFVESHADHWDWHLFDIAQEDTIKSKKISKRSVNRATAYALADSLNETLTGEPGFFSTKIAYTQEVPLKSGKHYSYIYMADYDGSNPQPVVEYPTISVSPKWNNDPKRPLIFYSENTTTNVRMMAIGMDKKRVMASNFEGINMLPAFSPDGAAVVFCATRGGGNCQLYHWANKQLTKLTNNNGNNFAPVYSADGKTIYFSSDFETGQPQIYAYSTEDKQLTRLTKDGYCVSPSYCASRNQLAYAKMVSGVMQLFVYDLNKKVHSQVTFDKAQKEECAWSPCGTFLMCPVDNGTSSRIAMYNTITQDYTYLTGIKTVCASPSWSGIYNEFPVIAS
jgi:TolB protein